MITTIMLQRQEKVRKDLYKVLEKASQAAKLHETDEVKAGKLVEHAFQDLKKIFVSPPPSHQLKTVLPGLNQPG